MEESSISPSPRELGKSNEARLSKLRRVLKETPGFALLTVTVEAGPMRAEVVRRLGVWAGIDGVPAIRVVSADREEPLADLAAGSGLALIEPDDSTSTTQIELAHRLNWQRDGLIRAVPGPLVVVVGRAGHQALFEQAPDLYSWRRHSVAIAREWRSLAILSGPRISDRGRDERLRLQETLEDLSSKGALPALAQAELRLRVGALLVREGLGKQAEEVLQRSLEVFQRESEDAGALLALIRLTEAALVEDDEDLASQRLATLMDKNHALESSGRFDEALGRYGKAGTHAAIDIALLSAYLRKALAPSEVLQQLEQAETLSQDVETEAEILAQKAAVLHLLDDSERAAECLERSISLFSELGDGGGQLMSLTGLSLLHLQNGRASDAVQAVGRLQDCLGARPELRTALQEASVAMERYVDASLQAAALAELGLNEGSAPRAPLEASPTTAMLVTMVATTALERHRDGVAIRTSREAEALLDARSDARSRRTRVGLMRQRAEVELELGEPEKAVATAEALEPLAVEPDSYNERGLARLLRATVALEQGAPSESLALLDAAESDLSLLGKDVTALAVTRLSQGRALLALQRPTEAIRKLTMSIQALHDLGRLEEAREGDRLLLRAAALAEQVEQRERQRQGGGDDDREEDAQRGDLARGAPERAQGELADAEAGAGQERRDGQREVGQERGDRAERHGGGQGQDDVGGEHRRHQRPQRDLAGRLAGDEDGQQRGADDVEAERDGERAEDAGAQRALAAGERQEQREVGGGGEHGEGGGGGEQRGGRGERGAGQEQAFAEEAAQVRPEDER
jgi:tetratricopeptide (TPR) repeat protein